MRDDDGELHGWAIALGGFITALILATGLVLFVKWQIAETRSDAAAEAARQVAAAEATAAVLGAKYDGLAAIVEAFTGTDVPPAAAIVEAVTVQGDKGDQGPSATDEQVRSAVALYFLANPPQPGRPATDAENERAVAVYCAANNCRGDKGDTGDTGAGGAPGPGPTDQQVADDVAAFCTANNNCAGPKGDTGAKGDKGDKGDPGDPATACPPGSSQQPRPAPPPYVAETWTVCVAA